MFVVYSLADEVSLGVADILKESLPFTNSINEKCNLKLFSYKNINLLEISELHINADFLNECNDTIMFLSKHISAKGISSFSVHPEGNWSSENKLGGKPKMLSVAAPYEMQKMLSIINKNNKYSIEVAYEATHHGPLLNNPSFFVEIGGNEEAIKNNAYRKVLAESVIEFFTNDEASQGKVALGIGGMHYERKFTKLALNGTYAFSHMLPKYQFEDYSVVEMIEQARSRSVPEAELAVIEKSSFNHDEKEIILKKLNDIGLDHVMV